MNTNFHLFSKFVLQEFRNFWTRADIRVGQDYCINHNFIKVPICWRVRWHRKPRTRNIADANSCGHCIFLREHANHFLCCDETFFFFATRNFYPLSSSQLPFHEIRDGVVPVTNASHQFSLRDAIINEYCLEQTVLIVSDGPWIIIEICVLGMRGLYQHVYGSCNVSTRRAPSGFIIGLNNEVSLRCVVPCGRSLCICARKCV